MSIRAVREPANAKVDIVFVHGLHGDQAPWTSEADVFWPEKLLPGKISDACILSFEYDAAVGLFFDEDDEVTDISNDLINELMDHRTEKDNVFFSLPSSQFRSRSRTTSLGALALESSWLTKQQQEERPIIFVAHCLGGVVLENALVRAAEHPRKKGLISCIHGILLLGTPHFQPDSLAAATKYLQTAKASIPSEPDLKGRLTRLSGIPWRFAELKQAGAEFEIEGFYGSKETKIVDEALARAPDAPPPERLARSHLRLSQYDAEDDKDFKKVVRVLTQWAGKIVLPEEEKGAANVSNATFSGSHNSGLQLGQNVGTLKEFSFGRAHTTEDIDRISLHALRCPDSLAVKNRLKESKDRLVHQSIQWILEDAQYKEWENGDEIGLLWIKGGAGKGKTMLSIGLIEQLARAAQAEDDSTLVIYSFCQNADYELNTLEAILKGLILQLANQRPELKESLRRRWDTIQEAFTEDVTSWRSLWNILFEMLARCKSSRVYMVVDALDECVNDDVVDFLRSIVRKGLDHPGKIKWLLTSRPWDGAERVLLAGPDQLQINLDGEYNSQSVSGAVVAYIASKVEQLSRQHRYGATLKSEMVTELTERSEGTFLWVSLVCKALESVSREDALATVQSLPPGLHPFYDGVLSQLNQGEPAEVQKCMRLLKAMMTVYRPLKVEEVASVIGLTDEEETIRALVDCCASLIRLREKHIEFIHQSARDYLAGENGLAILDSHGRFGHEEIVLACMSYLSECLKPDLVDLPRPDATRDSLEVLENRPNEPKNGILS
ncbi:uncharacterized protein J7T54_004110 [Emericellopsis cladophorae]|uniref:NACHT domain-containing protein n=1 Tax=Emericellopsis cladophorae TaxID=2686198 RepID=A0A9P9XVI7_9HYPO|nr:uncharacterized protein J7T54_004110 [Emericellopsis cladophorae]KAI6778215.1 hypothetical protein J7T54_004110 [Emericellopsis cladophorae]